MDWRSFLQLLTITIQASLSCFSHLRIGFAIYSSVGSLDMDCSEKMSLGAIKNMVCTPVFLHQRAELRKDLEKAWIDLTMTDLEATHAAARNSTVDPDNAMLTFKLFEKLTRISHFSKHFEIAECFGIRDPRAWLYELEKEYYHPIVIDTLKKARLTNRNDEEVISFREKKVMRTKRISLAYWKKFVSVRCKIRRTLIYVSVRWKFDHTSRMFDTWKKVTIAIACACYLQRHLRGFLGRCRRDFLRGIQRRAVKIQAGVRQIQARLRFKQVTTRKLWAVVTIQRAVRGLLSRRRVQTMVEELFDTGKLRLKYDRIKWENETRFRAAVRIQMVVLKFISRRRTMKKMKFAAMLDKIQESQEETVRVAKFEKDVHQQTLHDWFVKRKAEYDDTRMVEGNTAEQVRRIHASRNRAASEERERRNRIKEEALERQEERRIEQWLVDWDNKRDRRAIERGEMCRRALSGPETPEEVILRKDLQKRIQKHIKVVLRRADKQKIPMEIPEAQDLAEVEVIATEVELERERARRDQKEEAERILAEEARVAEVLRKKAEEERHRHRNHSALCIQGRYKCFLARKELRRRAYARFIKHFDPTTINYYYEDKRTHKTSWAKPLALGLYDVEADDGWVVMTDSGDGAHYYYCPKTWKMSWDLPELTVLCDSCGSDFACVRMNDDKKHYCEGCFNRRTQELLLEGHQAKEILFKTFKGNKEGAGNTKFTYMKDESLFKYIVSKDPTMASALEEEIKTVKIGKKIIVVAQLCVRCQKEAALSCEMCCSLFCQECFDYKHNKPPWSTHPTINLAEEKRLKEEKEQSALAVKTKKKKKKKASLAKIKKKEADEVNDALQQGAPSKTDLRASSR